MVILLILMLLASAPVVATPVTQVEAQDVDYDGKKVRLAGNVHVAHEFGEIFCSRAVLLLAEGEKRGFAPDRIILQGEVEIKLHDGSTISSDEADIDCTRLEGVFTAPEQQKVVYCTFVGDAKNRAPVKATSQAMKVCMKKSEATSNYEISDIQAEGAVKVEYLNALTAGSGEKK